MPWVKYRKKPVVIEARLITEAILIPTLEGTMRGNAGDYLVRGVDGELYPCKASIFEKTYDAVEPQGCNHEFYLAEEQLYEYCNKCGIAVEFGATNAT